MPAVQVDHLRGQLGADDARHRVGFARDDVQLQITRAQRRGRFEADEAGADDGHRTRAGKRADEPARVGHRAQHVHGRRSEAGQRQAHRLGAGRQQQLVVGPTPAIGAAQLARGGIERGDLAVKLQVDLELAPAFGWLQRHPLGRRAAGEEILGQVGPVVGRIGVGAEQAHGAVIPELAQAQGRCRTGGATSDDDDATRHVDRGPSRRGWGRGQGGTDPHRVGVDHDTPDRQRRQRRRGQATPAAQVEPGMVPGTAHLPIDHESCVERRAVVRAAPAHGEHLLAAS